MTRVAAALAILAALGASVPAGRAAAQDFSAGSEAAEWGLVGEEKARFTASVVDILCLLAGDCPPECGGGTRQLGLLREADGALVLAVKNGQPLFTGAATDLVRYCGTRIEVDGLLVGDPEQIPVKLFQVQRIRPLPDGAWRNADIFTEDWAARNPEAAAKGGEWFRADPRIAARLAAEGWFGLGLERDAEILKEVFP